MRKDFEMSEEDLEALLSAMKPVAMIGLQCGTPRSQQENANEAWRRLGEKLGFEYMTVKPNGKGDRFFSAEVTQKSCQCLEPCMSCFEREKNPATALDLSAAYIGAREDLAIWKKRALEAEETARQLNRALAEEVNGPTFMGEPVLPAAAPEPVAWINGHDLRLLGRQGRGALVWCDKEGHADTPLYLHPPATAPEQPSWHDAPTAPGVWFCDEGDICYTWTAHNIEILDQFDPGDGLRWFGPIPQDPAIAAQEKQK